MTNYLNESDSIEGTLKDSLKHGTNTKIKSITWGEVKQRLLLSRKKAGLIKGESCGLKKEMSKDIVKKATQLFNFWNQNKSFIEEFESKEFYRDQVVFLVSKNPPNSSYSILGALLGGSSGIICNQMIQKKKEEAGVIGVGNRPSLCQNSTLIKVKELINQFEDSNNALTVENITNLIEECEGFRPRNDSVRRWLKNNFNLITVETESDEECRIVLNPERVIKNYWILNSLLKEDDVPIKDYLVFNADEVGVCEEAQRRNQRVLAPEGVSKKIRIAEPSREKTSTLMACVSLSGKVIKPLVVVDKKSYIDELNKYFSKYEIVYNPSGFINSDIYKFWLDTVFIPSVNKIRIKHNEANKTAILIIDNCPSHIPYYTNRVCKENNIRVHWLFPHSSHLTQPLDLLPFANFKQNLRKYKKQFKMTMTNKEISNFNCNLCDIKTSFIPSLKKKLTN